MSSSSPRLILASASPRRQSLLRDAGYDPVVHPSNLDEASLEEPGILPADLAMRLAIAKAAAVSERFPDDVVLAADTVVAFGDQAIGKPEDAEDARNMLSLLAGTTHLVITAVAVQRRTTEHLAAISVTSAVRMRPLTAAQIDRYIATDAWVGKAGGYGIQDKDPFVERMTGCQTNIVGLPMTTTQRLLRDAGIKV
jgi:septum formation protein